MLTSCFSFSASGFFTIIGTSVVIGNLGVSPKALGGRKETAEPRTGRTN
jgi:hypothetical protein